MYFDEDGDLAHEFYKEVVRGDRTTMERYYDNLKPQVKSSGWLAVCLLISLKLIWCSPIFWKVRIGWVLGLGKKLIGFPN